jgi:hypothetical protein
MSIRLPVLTATVVILRGIVTLLAMATIGCAERRGRSRSIWARPRLDRALPKLPASIWKGSNLDIQIRVADKAMAESLERAGIPLQDGVISTTGRTVIDMQARTLSYILEGQPALQLGPPSGPLALIRPRHWELNGNVLTLTTKGDDGKPVSIGAWQKE